MFFINSNIQYCPCVPSSRELSSIQKQFLHRGTALVVYPDLKALAQKIEDGEIWPEKIPQKEHIPAFKFYRKTYGVPVLLFVVAPLLAWLTIAVMREDAYLLNKQIHNHGAVAMVWSMWGIVVSCLTGSRWVYLFSKDIKPVQRTILGVIVFGGLLWFIGCIYFMVFTN